MSSRFFPPPLLMRPSLNTQKLTRLGQELTNRFVVVMVFPNSDGTLSGGMTGVAKITVKSRPLAWQARSKRLALAAFSGLVVIAEDFDAFKKKGPPFLGRRPFGVAATSNSRPSGAQGRKIVKIS